ncbi:hypothetical protein ACWGFX_31965 [Streptomyces xanthophaeus]|uniref:hypothetical protein n=1 Tax=Streptomyces xanthophaeus TaxID=67385 RepID=UPI003716DC14
MSTSRTQEPGDRVPRTRPQPDPHRLSLPYVAALVTFPVLGTVLALAGLPTAEIIPLLGYCASIGVTTVLVASGGRRLAAGVASAVLRITR